MVLVGGTDAQAARPARCQGGYFLIDAGPLLPGGTAPDALVIDRGAVSTLSGCPSARAQVFKAKGKKKTAPDELMIRWPACGTVKRAMLRATISSDCSRVTGNFKAKGVKAKKFTGQDGIPADIKAAPWEGDPPAGAELVTPAEFIDASKEPGFRLLVPTQAADDAAAAAAADDANKATIAAFLSQHPERADFVAVAVDPNDPDIQPTKDGNYRLTIGEETGAGEYVITQGARAHRAEIAETIRRFPTHDNQLAVYRQLYDFAHTLLDPTLPTPDSVVGESAEELAARNRSIAAKQDQAEADALLPGEDLPESFPSRCSNEIGSGDGTDSSSYCEHQSGGLWRTATWPLKFYATCVKKQAGRGTCAAFATTAGREMRVAQRYNRWVNLSEQHLYFTAKRVLQPAEYGDGLNSSNILQQVFDVGYEQPLEQAWDYNPSNSRTENDETERYTNSCVDYNSAEKAYCSDTVHQGRFFCTAQGTKLACAAGGPRLGATTVKSITQPAELWDPVDPVNGMRNIIITLLDQKPMIIGMTVVSNLKKPDANGFVPFSYSNGRRCRDVPVDPAVPDVTMCEQTGDCLCSKGGHAVLAVGYIPQQKLPAGTPNSFGGFLIVKNSWGCKGDGGYYYLPAAYVRAFVHTARPIGDVEVVGDLPEQPVDNFHFNFVPAPPSIRIVQPADGDSYVAGQGVPLVLEGADFQYDQWLLQGPVHWTSNLQGALGDGQNTVATLTQGTHTITATYTGKRGEVVGTSVVVPVGPAPPDLPPTPIFTRYDQLQAGQCPPNTCGGAGTCILGFGQGSDPEDGALTSSSQVRWYLQVGNGPRVLGSTGASSGNQGKFIGCPRLCGFTFRFILEVEDSAGQRTESRRELETPDCVN